MNEFRQIKKISEFDFPPDLHGRIMRSLYLHQFKLPLFIINSLLLVNLCLSGWHLLTSIQEHFAGLGPVSLLARLGEVLTGASGGALLVLAVNASLLGVGLYLLFKLNQAILRAGRSNAGRKYADSQV